MAAEKVILPVNGRQDYESAESVFSRARGENIPMHGEIYRKLTHLGAIVIPLIYYFFGYWAIIGCLSFALIVSLVFDCMRLFGTPRMRSFIMSNFGILVRPKESHNFIGATYILVGSILTISLFDKPIAIAAITFIIFGDTAGAIIGRLWGIVKFRGKSLEGSVSFFLACAIASAIIPGIPFWVMIAGSLAATVVEAITLHIDDNLIVPLTSAALMQVLVSQAFILRHFA